MEYAEIRSRLEQCSRALNSIKEDEYNLKDFQTIEEKRNKLKHIQEILKKKLKVIKESEGVVMTKDEDEAEDLAKKGVNVKLTKEDMSEEEVSRNIAKQVSRPLIEALREVGDEVSKARITNIKPKSFDIYVEYKNDFEDTFSFFFDESRLEMVDDELRYDLGDIGYKPSGEAMINTDVVKTKLINRFKTINEEDDSRPSEKYLRLLTLYKSLPRDKRQEVKPKLQKAAKKLGIKLDLSGVV